MATGDVTVIAPVSIQGDDTKVVVRAKSVANGFAVCSTTNRDLINAEAKLGGFVVYNTTTSQLERWDGAAWVSVGGSGGGGAGFPFTFFALTVDGDPTAGGFRLNHATPASATSIFIDDVEAAEGTNVRDLLASYDDALGAIKGYLRIQSQSAPENWIVYAVGGYTSASGYGKLTGLTVVDSSTTVTFTTTAGDTFVSFDAVGRSDAVNLANSEVTGVLPESKGGTGRTALDITPVDVATTGNVALTGVPTNIDTGYTLVNGTSRILVWQNTAKAENGAYVYNSGGAWTRCTDFDAVADFRPGVSFLVRSGALYGKQVGFCTLAPTTLGSTDIEFGVTYTAPSPSVGANLTGGNQTIAISGGAQRTMPAGSTSGTCILTMATTGTPEDNEVIELIIHVQAHDVIVKDAALNILHTIAAGTARAAHVKYSDAVSDYLNGGRVRLAA